jgi:hypothetical protein
MNSSFLRIRGCSSSSRGAGGEATARRRRGLDGRGLVRPDFGRGPRGGSRLGALTPAPVPVLHRRRRGAPGSKKQEARQKEQTGEDQEDAHRSVADAEGVHGGSGESGNSNCHGSVPRRGWGFPSWRFLDANVGQPPPSREGLDPGLGQETRNSLRRELILRGASSAPRATRARGRGSASGVGEGCPPPQTKGGQGLRSAVWPNRGSWPQARSSRATASTWEVSGKRSCSRREVSV